MNEGDLDAGVRSFLAEKEMQEVRSYVSRGRSLRSVATDHLSGEWVSLVREWAADPRQPTNIRRDDIQAELTLRGIEPPYHLVKGELEAITKAATDAYENMSEAERREYGAEIVDFIAKEKSRRN